MYIIFAINVRSASGDAADKYLVCLAPLDVVKFDNPNASIERSCLIVYSLPPFIPRFCTENTSDSVGDGAATPVTVSVVLAVTLPKLSTENDGVQFNVVRTFSGQDDGYKKKSPLASTPASQYNRPW